MISSVQNYGKVLLLAIYAIASSIILITFDGTGERGSGDSVQHFLYSKYAFEMPELLLNQWAKPIFVLITAPFAQFGLIGVKIFNIIISGLSILYTYKTSKELKLNYPLVSAITLLSTPLFFILTFSGLTEPLFTFLLIYCTHLFLKNKFGLSIIILSLLPFVRSEGLLMIGVFGFYIAYLKKWKLLPLFTIGHIIYGLLGLVVYGDFLWVFTANPYAKLSSTYGSGELFHFVHQLFYVIGAPIYALFSLGVIAFIIALLKKEVKPFGSFSILIVGSFFCFLVAHSVFWYLGIFNSMGLKRVMISVAPQIGIVSLFGLNYISSSLLKLKHKTKSYAITFLTLIVIVFPFLNNKASINWEKDLCLTTQQSIAQQAANYVLEIKKKDTKLCYTDPYLSMLFDINPFDSTEKIELGYENFKKLKKGDLIVWDNWFGVTENGIGEDAINSLNGLKLLKQFTSNEDREITYLVFVKL